MTTTPTTSTATSSADTPPAPNSATAASLYQRLRGHLAVLKLHDAAEALPAVLDRAQRDGLSLTAALEALLAIEVDATEARRLAGRLRFACLPTPATLDGFDFDAAAGLDALAVGGRRHDPIEFLSGLADLVLVYEVSAVAATEEEDEAVQVGDEGVRRPGRVVDEPAESVPGDGVGADPVVDELEKLEQFDGVGGGEPDFAHDACPSLMTGMPRLMSWPCQLGMVPAFGRGFRRGGVEADLQAFDLAGPAVGAGLLDSVA